MLDVTAILHEALTPLGLPCSEAPMRATDAETYIVWQPGEKRLVYASGGPVLERQLADITLVLPDGQRWQERSEQVRRAVLATGKAAWITLEDVAFLPEIGRRAVTLRCSLWARAENHGA